MDYRNNFIIKKSNVRNYLIILALTIILIRPQAIISNFSNSVWVFAILQLMIILLLFVSTKILYINKFVILCLLYYTYDFVNTIIQKSGTINNVIIPAIWTFFAIYVLECCIRKIGIAESFRMLSYAVSTILWVNAIFMFAYPEGFGNGSHIANRYIAIYFLGQSNQMSIYILISILLFVCCIITEKKISLKYMIFSFFPVVLTYLNPTSSSSVTGKIGIIIIVAGFFIYLTAPSFMTRISKPFLIIGISLVFFFSLTRLLTLDSVSNFITNVLGKDVTLSERTSIWAQVYIRLRDIKTLIFGIGEVGGGGYIQIWTGNVFSAHNLLLQISLAGGLILVVIFVCMFVSAVKNISGIGDKNRSFLSIILLSFCFENMMEVYPFSMVVFVIFIFYIAGEYFKGKKCIAN